MATFDLPFRVRAHTDHGEKVCVVGACSALGNWKVQKAKILSLETKNSDGSGTWSKVIKIPFASKIEYRFFICHVRETDHEGDGNDIMVRKWETNIKPRTLSLQEYAQNPEIHQEATFGEYDGNKNIEKGWLTGQTEIHFRFYSEPIMMWKPSQRSLQYSVKCIPLDLQYKDHSSSSEEILSEGGSKLSHDEDSSAEMPSNSLTNKVKVSVLNGENAVPADQDQFGMLYKDGDYMIFRSQFFEIESMGYQFEFYIHEPNAGPGDARKYVGQSLILPFNLKDTIGVKTVPITNQKHKPIGQLKVDYLLIKPLSGYECDMSVSYARQWTKARTVDVGHRGMGSSYGLTAPAESLTDNTRVRKCEASRENTIASLAEAGSHGADFVEFDVQLSKDNIPVVYHDLTVSLTLKKKHADSMDWFDIPVMELDLQQLQLLKIDHVSEKKKGDPNSGAGSMHTADDPHNSHPFPTLKECFEALDPKIGFNVEIKYCMKLKSGELEENLRIYKERNEYVDVILKQILASAGSRKVIISSFDPDICTMVKLKQNRYPVLLLTQGDTKRYPPFVDQRANCTDLSICQCYAEQYLGINAHTEDLLRKPEYINFAKSLSLVVFCWGEDNNSTKNIKLLKNLDVDGIIYDRIDELKPTHAGSDHQVFSLDDEEKVQLLLDVGAIHMNSCNEASPDPIYKGQSQQNTGDASSTDNGVGGNISTSAGCNGSPTVVVGNGS